MSLNGEGGGVCVCGEELCHLKCRMFQKVMPSVAVSSFRFCVE